MTDKLVRFTWLQTTRDLVLNAVISSQRCCVELENQELKNPAVRPDCLDRDWPIQDMLWLALSPARGGQNRVSSVRTCWLRPTGTTCRRPLPHKAYVRRPKHFQTRTWAAWLGTVRVAACSYHRPPPGNTAYGDEGTSSPRWNLITWHHIVLAFWTDVFFKATFGVSYL